MNVRKSLRKAAVIVKPTIFVNSFSSPFHSLPFSFTYLPNFSFSFSHPLKKYTYFSQSHHPWRSTAAFNRSMAERGKKKAAAPGIGVRKQKIFPHASSLASIESLSLPLVQEIVLTADIGCAECQKKLANILSKMNDTESVVVNLRDKKVILTRRLQNPSTCNDSPSRVSTIKRLLGSSFR